MSKPNELDVRSAITPEVLEKCPNPNCQDGRTGYFMGDFAGTHPGGPIYCMVCHGKGMVPRKAPPNP